jgi:DNA-binding NarL/FixJ family response regulator
VRVLNDWRELMHPYRIILADDHLLFRKGLKRIIEDSQNLSVIGEAGDGLELLELLKKTKPDMIILDISMPNLRGLEATHEIKSICPEAKILILTMHRNKEYLLQTLSAKADGYLLKEDTDAQLIAAIRSIRGGKIFLSPLMSDDLSQDLLGLMESSDRSLDKTLSTREKEVLTLLAEGKSSSEIADLLYISQRTVEHHRASINKKLKAKNIVDLVKYAIRKGYTSQHK